MAKVFLSFFFGTQMAGALLFNYVRKEEFRTVSIQGRIWLSYDVNLNTCRTIGEKLPIASTTS